MAHLLHSAFPSVPRKQSLMLSAAAPQAIADDFRRGPSIPADAHWSHVASPTEITLRPPSSSLARDASWTSQISSKSISDHACGAFSLCTPPWTVRCVLARAL